MHIAYAVILLPMDNPESTPPLHTRQIGKVIQPTSTPKPLEETKSAHPVGGLNVADIYPDASKEIHHDPDARHSININFANRPNLADKTIASQVKVLLVYAILELVGSVIFLGIFTWLAMAHPDTPGLGFGIIAFAINLPVFLYLLLAKSQNGVALVLKILLVFNIISVFGIFFGVAGGLSLSSVLSLLLSYVSLVGVRNLSRNNW